MLVFYQGPHPEVVVDELDQSTVIVAGQPVEIPDDLAARLIEQDTWRVAETPEEKAAREKREQDEAAAVAAAQADAAAQATVAADGTPVDTTTAGSN